MNFDNATYELDLINNCLKIKLSAEPINRMVCINVTFYVGLDKAENVIYIEIHNIKEIIQTNIVSAVKDLIK